MKTDTQQNMETENESQELFEHHRIVVDKGQKAMRVDKYLFNRLEGISRNRIQDSATAGQLLVNKKSVKSNYKVKPNDVVTLVMDYPKYEFKLLPEDIPLDIVYEDEDLLVVNKVAGMVVHPSFGHHSGTLVNALAYHLKNNPLFQTEDPRPGLVHRIDKNTSGLLLIAKTEQAKTHLSLQFFEHTVKRIYQALVWGDLKEKEGTITGNIGRSLKNRKIQYVFPEGDFGKHAVTHYKLIERFNYISLIECRLETGRTHQIRVHMQYIKHPLFNDASYGGDQILKGTTFSKYKQFVQNCFKILPRHALHAKTLGFIHPRTGKEMFFDSELPADIAQTIEKWRAYTTINR